MRQEKIQIYSKNKSGYPKKLLNITRPPSQLHVLGKLPDENKTTVAIVGARNATPYGRKKAWEFAYALSQNGIQVISGFARGIDRAGHEGALDAGCPTFAVLGNGIDICYPKENQDLYNRILEGGGFLSEFPVGTPPCAKHFPMRNRLISALSDVVLVVEARVRSGALITADFALEQGKDVYAVPGRVDDALSIGCNQLIAQGAAIAVSPEEMLKNLKMDEIYLKSYDKKNKITLAKEEETVYTCIGLEPKHVEEILTDCQMNLQNLVGILLELELKNMIKEVTKNYYIRL